MVRYNDFLDVAIGEHSPYDDAALYMQAVMKKLTSAGIDLAALMHAERRIRFHTYLNKRKRPTPDTAPGWAFFCLSVNGFHFSKLRVTL